MDVAPDAKIVADEAIIKALAQRLLNLASPRWQYSHPPTEFAPGTMTFLGKMPGGESVRLWLVPKHLSEGLVALEVTNIVPGGTTVSRINPDEYRALALSFLDDVKALGSDLEFETRVDATERTVDNYLWPLALRRALDAFTGFANTACLHPLDRERWQGFTCACHVNRKKVPSVILAEHLVQSGFDADSADSLTHDYEQGLALLTHYDEMQRRSSSRA